MLTSNFGRLGRWISFNSRICVYCGNNADTVDHFPPRSASFRGLLLPCCRECNNLAGTEHPFDFARRVELVKEKIKKRNKKILDMPIWHQDEIEELGPNMRRQVILCQNKRRNVHRRLAWNAFAHIAFIVQTNDSALVNAVMDFITINDWLQSNSSDS